MDNNFEDIFFKRNGRLNRLRYLKRNLAIFGINFLLILVGTILLLGEYEDTNSTFEIYVTICGLLMLYPRYCLDVRRLQDLDGDTDWAKWIAGMGALAIIDPERLVAGSGLIGLLGIFVVLAYVGISLYLVFAPGTKGDNKYGADPLAK